MRIKGRHSVLGALEFRPECVRQVWAPDATLIKKQMKWVKHQGYAAEIELSVSSMQTFFKQSSGGFWLALDHIEDPQNFGAICRSAALLGVRGVIYAKARQAQITDTVAQASAGLIFAIELVRVPNIGQFIDQFKSQWHGEVFGLDMAGDMSITQWMPQSPSCLVVGSEGKGISQKVLSRIDRVVSLPMVFKGHSFNAAQSVSIALYQAFINRSERVHR